MEAVKHQAEVVKRGKQAAYLVIEVPGSKPGVMYRVDVTNARCSCPAWKFQRGHNKLCKHLLALGVTEPKIPDHVTAPTVGTAPTKPTLDYSKEL